MNWLLAQLILPAKQNALEVPPVLPPYIVATFSGSYFELSSSDSYAHFQSNLQDAVEMTVTFNLREAPPIEVDELAANARALGQHLPRQYSDTVELLVQSLTPP